MKKTNVMIEVTDELYEEIINPLKKQRSFGKLVVQLLEAYRSNESIYSYINGTIDKLDNEANEELLKDLNNMTQSLNMLGVLQEQVAVTINEGSREFNAYSEKAKNDSNKFSMSEGKESQEVLTRDDVVKIVDDSVSDIKKMLQELMERGTVPQPVAKQVEEVVENKMNESVSRVVVKEDNDYIPMTYVEKEISNEDEELAKNALSSLMDSLPF